MPFFQLRNFLMNDAYKDFLKDSAENQEGYQPARYAAHDYAQMFYERKAADLEITVDYYIQEFL